MTASNVKGVSMHMRSVLTLTAVTSLMCAGAIRAEEAAAKPPVDKPAGERAPRMRAEGFKAADADGNGVLSLDEFKAMQTKQLEAMKARMGDKFNAERAAKMPTPEAQFTKLDTDANGSLTLEEYSARRRAGGQGRVKVAPPAKEEAAPVAPVAPAATM